MTKTHSGTFVEHAKALAGDTARQIVECAVFTISELGETDMWLDMVASRSKKADASQRSGPTPNG